MAFIAPLLSPAVFGTFERMNMAGVGVVLKNLALQFHGGSGNSMICSRRHPVVQKAGPTHFRHEMMLART